MTGLLAELYERCELEAQNPLPMTAVNIFSQRSRNYGPANFGVAHSNQLNFLEHSEERIIKYDTVSDWTTQRTTHVSSLSYFSTSFLSNFGLQPHHRCTKIIVL